MKPARFRYVRAGSLAEATALLAEAPGETKLPGPIPRPPPGDRAPVTGGGYLAGLLFSLPGGRLADRLGVRPALLGGLAVGAIGLFASALAPSFLGF